MKTDEPYEIYSVGSTSVVTSLGKLSQSFNSADYSVTIELNTSSHQGSSDAFRYDKFTGKAKDSRMGFQSKNGKNSELMNDSSQSV